MFSTAVFTSIREIPEPGLRNLNCNLNFYDTTKWMRYCELAARGSLRYLTLMDRAGRIGALTAIHILAAPPAPALRRPETLIDGKIVDTSELYPCLMGVLEGTNSPLLLAPEQENRRPRVVAEVAVAAAGYGAGHNVTTVAFPYLASEADAQAVSGAIGAGDPVLSAGVAMLTGSWDDFDGYLQSLDHHRRARVRYERRKFIDAGYRVSAVNGTSDLDESTARLQVSTLTRHGTAGRLQSLLEGYQMLRRTVEDHVVTFRYENSGTLAGIVVCLRDRETLYVRTAGIPAGGTSFEYFNAVYYSPIEWGIENGIRRFCFGAGAYRAKRLRGCVFEPRYAAVRWPRAHARSCLAAAREVSAARHAELGSAANGTGQDQP